MSNEKYRNLYCKIEELAARKEWVLLAIDGPSGAGKSTFSAQLQEKYGGNVFHMDDFFLPKSLRTPERMNELGGNIHYERLEAEILQGLRRARAFTYHIYDCHSDQFIDRVKVEAKKINILEGVYSMHPRYGEVLDLKIFFDIDVHTQKQRIIQRSGEEMYCRFETEWIPRENSYFQTFNIRGQSDFVYAPT